MMVLITYDVNTETPEGRRRLRQVSKVCQNYGQRVQNSVFECLLDPAQLKLVQNELLNIMDEENDSLRFYNLGKNYSARIEQYGCKQSYDPQGPLVL
ncbi:MAG: CRISPR-associated endonuclease Cas2 [Clostridia bacterium]|nr:CRISPR-associated endonuclease Cas2 [Clostridia bacterium]MBR6109877.1 CRISPR-associated endonuclease Cas2 [Clostridia bacterium]